MAETAVKREVSTPFLDDTDDFIQSHIDSHLPSSEEVDGEGSDDEVDMDELEPQSDAESDLDDDITDVQDYHPSILGIPADGKEINGYEAKVITGFTENDEPISEMRYIDNRDPLKAYKTESGDWSDTDSDGIPDVVESWFSNTSIATDPAYREQFQENADGLYGEYSWVVGHFHTIKEEENESKAEQWLTDQFNPISLELCSGNRGSISDIPEDVREKTPPMVTKYTAEFYWDTSGWWPDLKVKTHAKVRDVGGIEDVELKDLDNGESHSPDLDGTPTSIEFEHTFDTSVLTASIGSVELELSAEDTVGNEVEVEEEVKGAIDTVLDALGQVWDAIAEVLGEVAEAVAESVSVVVEWIIDIATELFESAIQPLLEGIGSYFENVAGEVNDMMENFEEEGTISTENLTAFLQAVLTPTAFAFVTITSVLIYIAGLASKVATMGADTLLTTVVGAVLGVGIAQKSSEISAGLSDFGNFVTEVFEDLGAFSQVSAIISFIVMASQVFLYSNNLIEFLSLEGSVAIGFLSILSSIWASNAKEDKPEFAEGMAIIGFILSIAGLGMILKDLAGIGSAGGSDASAAVITFAVLLSFNAIWISVASWAVVVESQ